MGTHSAGIFGVGGWRREFRAAGLCRCHIESGVREVKGMWFGAFASTLQGGIIRQASQDYTGYTGLHVDGRNCFRS